MGSESLILSHKFEPHQYAWDSLDWGIRVCEAAWVEHLGFEKEAAILRDLPHFAEQAVWEESKPILDKVYRRVDGGFQEFATDLHDRAKAQFKDDLFERHFFEITEAALLTVETAEHRSGLWRVRVAARDDKNDEWYIDRNIINTGVWRKTIRDCSRWAILKMVEKELLASLPNIMDSEVKDSLEAHCLQYVSAVCPARLSRQLS